MGDFVNGVMMGAAGAGAGYVVSAYKNKEAINQASEIITNHNNLLKKFERYGGYKEAMDAKQVAYDHLMKRYQHMRDHGASFKFANLKKNLDRIYNQTMKTLPKNIEAMEKLKQPYEDAVKKLAETKAAGKKAMLIGAGVGVGLVVLNSIRKAIFGGHKAQ